MNARLLHNYNKILDELKPLHIRLVAVSKMQPVQIIKELYKFGQKDFGENYVQELIEKQGQLPADIRWHFIGHLQSNKVKTIIPFIHLIHGVDSVRLLSEINKQATKAHRKVNCLLQVHIAEESTKFGFSENEITEIDLNSYPGIQCQGLMGIASFTDDTKKVQQEFQKLHVLFNRLKERHDSFSILSMGMSADYTIGISEGSNMIRIGSLFFGERKSL